MAEIYEFFSKPTPHFGTNHIQVFMECVPNINESNKVLYDFIELLAKIQIKMGDTILIVPKKAGIKL